MNAIHRYRRGFPLVLPLMVLAGLGCEGDPPSKPESPPKQSAPAVEAKRVLAGRNVWLEVQGDKRRVLVNATVCLRQGQLEQFMCRKQTKEHEAIVTADVDARDIHKALLAAGAVNGSPVTFQPKYKPATGSTVKVSVQYEDNGKLVTVRANEWVRNAATRKDLEPDWVFAGSRFIPDPEDKKKPEWYLANDGDIICVSNFESALLDLPINSPKDNSDLVFEAHTERIPPRETKVLVILEPVPELKKK